MLIRTTKSDPASLIPAIRQAVDGPDLDQQVLIRFSSMEKVLNRSASSERFQTVLLGCFAGVALLLALVGVYGVMAYSTSQRSREFGIRIALGAQSRQIIGSVVAGGALLCGVGIAIGIAASLVLGQLLKSLLFGVDSLDLTEAAHSRERDALEADAALSPRGLAGGAVPSSAPSPVSEPDPQVARRIPRVKPAGREYERRDAALQDMPRPRCVSLRIPGDELREGAVELIQDRLARDPRILVEPSPRLERRGDGSLAARFYSVGGLAPTEVEALSRSLRQLAAR